MSAAEQLDLGVWYHPDRDSITVQCDDPFEGFLVALDHVEHDGEHLRQMMRDGWDTWQAERAALDALCPRN